jgi:hypothetical protein
MITGGMGWREPPHPVSTALCSVRGLPEGALVYWVRAAGASDPPDPVIPLLCPQGSARATRAAAFTTIHTLHK